MPAKTPSKSTGSDNYKYELSVRQQPKQARMCGSGDRADRRPIDPPPIIRLRIRDRSKPAGENEPQNLIQSPFYFMFASLVPPETDEELFCVANTKSRYLTGTCVSSLYHLRDPSDNTYSAFFVFPDVGVRVEGTYRFRLTMYEIAGNEVHQCASIFTNPFHVFSAKRFPGMEGSTELSKSFAEQGIRIRIRRPVRHRRRTAADVTGDEGEAEAEPAAKRAKVASPATNQPAQQPQYGHPMYAPQPGYPPQSPSYGYPVPQQQAREAAGRGAYAMVPPVPQYMPPPSQQYGGPPASPSRGQQYYPYPYGSPGQPGAPPSPAYSYSQPGRPYPYAAQQPGTPTSYNNGGTSNGAATQMPAYPPSNYGHGQASPPQQQQYGANYAVHPSATPYYATMPPPMYGNSYGQTAGPPGSIANHGQTAHTTLPPMKVPQQGAEHGDGAVEGADVEGQRANGSLASLLN